MEEMVQAVERKRHRPRRWAPGEREAKIRSAAAQMLGMAGRMAPAFLLSFAEIVGIPSGLHAAWMGAMAAAGQSLLWPLCGSLMAGLMRLVWGLPLRPELLLAALVMLMSPGIIFGRGALRLMGFTALSLAPCLLWSLIAGTAADAVGAAGCMAIAALSAPVMLRALRTLSSDRPISAMEERVAAGYVAAMLIGGGSRMLLFGINVGAAGAAALTLGMGLVLGAGAGTMIGLVTGLMLAMQGLPLAAAVSLALGGFLAGISQCLGRRWIACIGFALGSGTALLVASGAGAGCLGAVVLASAVTALLPRGGWETLQRQLRRLLPAVVSTADHYAAAALMRWEKTMAAMAREVPVPGAEDGTRTSSWWKCHLCCGCPDDADCTCMLTELARDHAEAAWQAREQEDEGWRLSRENLRGLGCGRLYYLRESMTALRREDALRQRECVRLRREREMLVTHLNAMAGAAKRCAMMSAGESWWDEMSARQLRRAAAEGAYPAGLVYARRVQGHAQVCWELYQTTGGAAQAEELCALTARTLEIPMRVDQTENGRITLTEQPLWQTECAAVSMPAEEGGVCGDTAVHALLGDGRHMLTLSDGMGHGETARQESEKTVRLLTLCLEAGYSREQALEAVNGMMLLTGRSDRFATVDLTLTDLWSGVVTVDKLGAAAGWLVRGRELTEITGEGLPLGILEDVDSRCVCFRVKEGDQLLLMTDGVEEAFVERDALKDALLRAADAPDASAAAWSLMHSAEEGGAPGGEDDRTAAVIRFSRFNTVQKAKNSI